jgi:hypothetical protein
MPGNEIAATVGVSPATVSRVLKRLRLSKLSTLEPAEPPRRYQREQPGEMIRTEISSAAVTEGAASCARGAVSDIATRTAYRSVVCRPPTKGVGDLSLGLPGSC